MKVEIFMVNTLLVQELSILVPDTRTRGKTVGH